MFFLVYIGNIKDINIMVKIPKSEIDQRIKKFQVILQKKELDGALIMQNVDIFYFSGTIQSSNLFIPAEGNPILMVLKNIERVKQESEIRTIVSIKERASSIFSVLKDYGFNKLNVIGLEMDVLPTHLYLWLKAKLDKCRWVDVSRDILKLRMIKTSHEIEQIREATAILHKGFLEIRNIIRVGMTELELDAHLSMIARREGHMGILRMRGWNQEMTYAHVLSGESGSVKTFLDSPHGGSGNTPAMAQGAGFRRIKRNEPIGIDFGVGINGYLGDQFRTYVIGELSEKLERAHACSKRIHDIISSEGRPGKKISDLYWMAEEEAKASGLEDFFMGCTEEKAKFIAHGIGLEIDEYPIITPSFQGKLHKGMVFALEPEFVFPGEGVIGLEDDYLVTPEGLKRLTLTDQEIMRIIP
jgi:Xaa-Pro aminopeptidase